MFYTYNFYTSTVLHIAPDNNWMQPWTKNEFFSGLWADPESFVRESPTLTILEGREDLSKYQTISGQSSARQQNAI